MKPEFRIPKALIADVLQSSDIGLRISSGLRASEFGIQVHGPSKRRALPVLNNWLARRLLNLEL